MKPWHTYKRLILASGLLAFFLIFRLFGSVSIRDIAQENQGGMIVSNLYHAISSHVSPAKIQNSTTGAEQFSEKRHKRALAGNVYVHEPSFSFIHFFYAAIVYRRFYAGDITERNYLHPSLRAPPVVC
jgi:hypothetical protein